MVGREANHCIEERLVSKGVFNDISVYEFISVRFQEVVMMVQLRLVIVKKEAQVLLQTRVTQELRNILPRTVFETGGLKNASWTSRLQLHTNVGSWRIAFLLAGKGTI